MGINKFRIVIKTEEERVFNEFFTVFQTICDMMLDRDNKLPVDEN